MKFLLLLASLVAGGVVAWLTILGASWYVSPIFLVAGGLVSIALDNAVRLRIAAFALGMIAVYAVEVSDFVRYIDQQQRSAQTRIRTEPAPTPVPRSGLFS